MRDDSTPDAASVAARFNEAITSRDLEALDRLMTDDHVFVDTAGGTVEGRRACRDAWRGFFAAFPDYRNHFTAVVADGDLVAMAGRSDCSYPELAGPALWRAAIRDSRVARWQVLADTPANRRDLGLPVASANPSADP